MLSELPGPIDLVLSISAGKGVEPLLASLLPLARSATLTRAEPTRSLDPTEVARLASEVAPGTELRVVPNPHLAVRAARERVGPGEALCVTGSVYLAGIARKVLRQPDASRVAVTRGRSSASSGEEDRGDG